MANSDGLKESRPTFAEVVSRSSSGYKTISEMVVAVLREGILAGAFTPGERLRQQELAETIGVSRIPVRSALMQLEAEGLVNFHPHRGAVVTTLTVEQARETYELRALLETYALRRSMARMTTMRAQTLVELGHRLDKRPEGGQFLDERVRFYRELYDAAENPVLIGIIEELRGTVGRYLLGLRLDHQHDGHGKLAELAARGDVEGAEECLRQHLDEVCRGLIGVLTGDVVKNAKQSAVSPASARTRKKRSAAG